METAVPFSAALSESTGLDTILLSDHTHKYFLSMHYEQF